MFCDWLLLAEAFRCVSELNLYGFCTSTMYFVHGFEEEVYLWSSLKN